MKIKYLKSFEKDIDKLLDKRIKKSLLDIIENIKNSNDINDIPNIKKLSKGKIYFRIRVSNYRLGISIKGEYVSLIRFLHRKDIYKMFP